MLGFNFGHYGQLSFPWTRKINSEALDKNKEKIQKVALAPIDQNDGAIQIDTGYGLSGVSNDDSILDTAFNTSVQLVNEYRTMAFDSDVDMAIDDIVNAAIVADEDDEVVTLDLDKVDLSETIKTKTVEAFEKITRLLQLNTKSYELFRSWYVDGRQYFQVLVDEEKKSEGIKALVNLDPRGLSKVKRVRKELNTQTRIEEIVGVEKFYVYNPKWIDDRINSSAGGAYNPNFQTRNSYASTAQPLILPEAAVAFVHSGIMSPDNTVVFSHLEKARKPLNNLKSMRDGAVIYRITRSPERRAFYVDTGSLPKKAAEQYVQELANKHRSKLGYDTYSGKIVGQPYQQSMLEDFWLPRLEGGRGTEIGTIAGGSNLGEITDILYFQKVMYRALNVPVGRLEDDGASIISSGSSTGEISRDEWKFNKFIQRLRGKYSELFSFLLMTELVLTGVCTEAEWLESFNGRIKFMYKSDLYLKEKQETDKMMGKIAAVAQATEYVGQYYSLEWVQREILKFDEEQIKLENERMEAEALRDADLKARIAQTQSDIPNEDDLDTTEET